jgi:hypothetical protein
MSATYDINLASDVDWVRFLIYDTDTSAPMLTDQEIAAIVAKQTSAGIDAPRYYAASECLAVLHTRYLTGGRGKSSKKVGQLAVVYGTASGINADLAVQARIAELRKEAARLDARDSSRSFAFRMS